MSCFGGGDKATSYFGYGWLESLYSELFMGIGRSLRNMVL
jgi:hypothetical protein